jgi:acetyl esterase/lipase
MKKATLILRRPIFFFLLVSHFLIAAENNINEPLDKPDARRTIYKTIDGLSLYIYIYEPDHFQQTDSRPAIVFFHGGGWRNGTSTQFDAHCRYLAQRGLVAMQADYRVMERHGVTPFECVSDAKSAIRWVRQHADQLGIDPNRIAAGGGSAGGHLAAACATVPDLEHGDDNLAISSKPNALVLFNPVFDNGPDGYRYDLFGERYTEISPMHNIHPVTPPTIVFLGTEDKNIPVSTAQRYREKMHAVGSRCDLKLYEGQGHGFFNLRKGGFDIYAQTIEEMDDFLISLGYLHGEPDIQLLHEVTYR